MPFCAIQCPNCGSVSCHKGDGGTYVCESCDTSFIWRENSPSTIVNTASDQVLASLNSCTNALDTLYGDSVDDDFEILDGIGRKYHEILQQRPDCWQAYWGLVRVLTVNFHDENISRSEFGEAQSYYNKALRFAEARYPEDVANMKRIWKDYQSHIMGVFDESEKEFTELRNEYNELLSEYEAVSESYNLKRGRLADTQRKLEQRKQKVVKAFKLAVKVLIISIIVVVVIGLFDRALSGKLTTAASILNVITIGLFVYHCARRVEYTVTTLQLQKQLEDESAKLKEYSCDLDDYKTELGEYEDRLS